MPQILKEDYRLNILQQAKKELLEYGYKDASMRRIAQRADMTVGNLYRYFENKEEMINQIVAPTKAKLDFIVQKYTDNNLSLLSNDFHWTPGIKSLTKIMDNVADDLMDVYCESNDELMILLNEEQVNESIKQWLTELINSFISKIFIIDLYKTERQLVAKIYAASFIKGIEELLRSTDVQANTKRVMLKVYFRSFISMLNLDIKKMLGK